MMFTKPTFKAFVRRSCRIAKTGAYGSYQDKISARGKMLNPQTGRMVYVDGKTGKSIKNSPPNPELDFFEQMKQKLIQEEKKPVLRRSERLKEKKCRQKMIDDGLDTTVRMIRPKKRQKIHLGDTIRMLTDTFVMTKLMSTIRI